MGGVMSRFYSSFEKQIDTKGRVSVPASFRASVQEAGGEKDGDRIFCFPSLIDSAIECYAKPQYDALLESVLGVIETPEAREQLELAIIARTFELTFDGDGRVTFPDKLLKAAGIEKAVALIGRGDRFQLWQPEAWAEAERKALEAAASLRHLLMRGGRTAPAIPALKPEGAV